MERFPQRDDCVAPLPPLLEGGLVEDKLAVMVDKTGPYAIKALGLAINTVAWIRGIEPIHPAQPDTN